MQFTIAENTTSHGLLDWLRNLGQKRFGFLRTPDGDEFVVLRPEQISELESILADPEFFAAVEHGIADLQAGRVLSVADGRALGEAVQGVSPCNPAVASAVERGVDDVLAGRVAGLRGGQPLSSLLSEHSPADRKNKAR